MVKYSKSKQNVNNVSSTSYVTYVFTLYSVTMFLEKKIITKVKTIKYARINIELLEAYHKFVFKINLR